MSVQQSDLNDPALVTEVDLARAAAQEEAGDERVGKYVSYHIEDETAVTHHFEADKIGYGGWRWAVTLTSAGQDADITVSEVVLLPGPSALTAPAWIPWQDRVQAGDLGVGDLLPTSPDDPRLVPAYVASDDPQVEATAVEVGLGRVRVMSREARLEAADRWYQSEFGPRSDMARGAPAQCGTCAFYLPLAGALQAAFGTCGNEISPADAHVVHVEYGCGAHSEADVEQVSPVLVADLIYDDALLDVEPLTVVDRLLPEDPAPADAAPAPSEEPKPVATPVATPDTAPTPEPVAAEPLTQTKELETDSASVEPVPASVPEVGVDPTPAESSPVEPGEADGQAEPGAEPPAEAAPEVAEQAAADVHSALEPADSPSAESAPGVPAEGEPASSETAEKPDASAEAGAPAESAESAVPAESAESAVPAEPAVPAESAESAVPAEPAEPAVPAESAASVEADEQDSAGPVEGVPSDDEVAPPAAIEPVVTGETGVRADGRATDA